jgi:hypothetical protein
MKRTSKTKSTLVEGEVIVYEGKNPQKVVLQSALSGPVAQLVEQRIENPRVDGSIPSQATKLEPPYYLVARGFFIASNNQWCHRPVHGHVDTRHIACSI